MTNPALLAALRRARARAGYDIERGGQGSIFRAVPLADIEVVRGGSGREIVAYASIYDTPYPVRDQYGDYDEVVRSGAFDAALAKGSAPQYIYNHGYSLAGEPLPELQTPLGVLTEVRSDRKGLITRAVVKQSPLGDEVIASARDGSLRAYSFRGPVHRSEPAGRYFRPGPGGRRTTVTRHALGLVELGPTPLPVSEGAQIVAVRGYSPYRHADPVLDGLGADIRRAVALAHDDPGSLAVIERAVAVISARSESERFLEIDAQLEVIRSRLAEIGDGEPADDEDEVDELMGHFELLDEEREDILLEYQA